MTRGQRILLWTVVVGALTIGLLLPFGYPDQLFLYRGLEDANLPLTLSEFLGLVLSRWSRNFTSHPTYPLSTLVGIIAAYMALRKS